MNKKNLWKFIFGLTPIFLLLFIPNSAFAKNNGKAWQIKPEMDLIEIQNVFDSANDGDIIIFKKGVYDFSSAEFSELYPVGLYVKGAIEIVNKSLAIIGNQGTLIKGIQSDMLDGRGVRGIIAFLIKNPDYNKDVVLKNLTFESFLNGVSSICLDENNPGYDLPNLRNLTIKNCNFKDIHRNAITVSGLQGNLEIKNNKMQTNRMGIWLGWFNITPMYQPCGSTVEIKNNTFELFGDYIYNMGIYVDYGNNFIIANNNIKGENCYGMLIANVKESTSAQGKILNNNVADSRYGIFLNNAHSLLVNNNSLSNIIASGIVVWGSFENEITYNNIEMNAPLSGVTGHYYNSYHGILTYGHHNIYLGNTVSGTGSSAILLGSLSGNTANNEYFYNNNVINFTHVDNAAYYIFFYNTYDNTIYDSTFVSYLNYGDSSNQFIQE